MINRFIYILAKCPDTIMAAEMRVKDMIMAEMTAKDITVAETIVEDTIVAEMIRVAVTMTVTITEPALVPHSEVIIRHQTSPHTNKILNVTNTYI